MNDHFKAFEGPLKFALANAYGGALSDWTSDVNDPQRSQTLSAQFKNAVSGIVLNVTDQGVDTNGLVQFSSEREGTGDKITMSVPLSCKNLKF